jgi:hypothetical protein
MYPAIEIALHLDRICAAQRQRPSALDAAFLALDIRHQPAPPPRFLAKGPRPRCIDRCSAHPIGVRLHRR